VTKQEVNYVCRYYPSGSLQYERWGYPWASAAWQKYDAGRSVACKHREDGPAMINYNKRGKVTQSKWYYNDTQIPANEVAKFFVDSHHPTENELLLFKLANF